MIISERSTKLIWLLLLLLPVDNLQICGPLSGGRTRRVGGSCTSSKCSPVCLLARFLGRPIGVRNCNGATTSCGCGVHTTCVLPQAVSLAEIKEAEFERPLDWRENKVKETS